MAMGKFDGAVENQEYKKLIHKTNVIKKKIWTIVSVHLIIRNTQFIYMKTET